MTVVDEPSIDDHIRLKQENERLWCENNALRPMVSDLQHKLSIAIIHLKAAAQAETATLIRKDPEDHG